jgi:hypothetical protein
MKTNILSVKSHGAWGPGGWHCHCCGPAPKQRKKEARLHKKRLYRLLNRLEHDSEEMTCKH